MSMKRHIFILVVFALAMTSTSAQEESNYQRSSKRSEAKGFKPVTDTEKMRRWGIIIGINSYDDPTINSLRYASADARAIYEVLTHPQTGGFKKEQLHLLTSDSGSPPTRNNILESLALLNRMIRAGDTVVFYFSGHGLTQGGINYLLPADTRVNILTETAILLSKVYAAIQNAKQQIIFLDACHSGQRRDKGMTSGAMSSAFAEAVFSEVEGRVTLASCNINESSFEDDKLGHGVFTYYLLEALRGKVDMIADKRITTSEANRYVVEKVKAWAFANRKRQNPRISSNVSGEIVLTTATFPRVPPKPSVDPDSATPIVGTFDQTVAQIKTLEAELGQNRQRVRQRVEENWQRGEQEIAKFRKAHKLNVPKDMFESDADYDKRINRLNALVEERRELVQKRHLEDIQGYLGDIQTRIARLSQIARLYRRVFPTNDLTVTLGTYDANNEFFPIAFEVNLDGESHRYKSRLSLNKDDARTLYHSWDKVIKTGYLSIDPGYRQALAMVKLEYSPVWQQGFTYTFNEVFPTGEDHRAVAFSPDGGYLATGNTRYVILWEVNSGMKVWQGQDSYSYPTGQFYWQPDPFSAFQSVIPGGTGWNQVEKMATAFASFSTIAFSPHGRYLATGDSRLRSASHAILWKVNSGRQIWQRQQGMNVTAICFSPDGGYLATGNTRYVILWEVNSGTKVRQMGHGGDVNAVSFSPDGKYLATGDDENEVTIWEVNSGKKVQQMEHGGSINAVSFSPDGKYLVTGDTNKKVNLWQMSTAYRLWQMGHGGSVNAASFSPDGQYFAVGGADKKITFYRIPTNITIDTKITKERVIQTSDEVKNLAWSPYGNLISDGKKVYRTLLQPEIMKETH